MELSQTSSALQSNGSALKHILVVDDERVVLELFETLFEGDPLLLTCVETGREALELVRQGGINVVIVDKNLADISGLEVLKTTKALSPLTEVIIITGAASLDSVLMAIELDAFDYILKPLHNIYDIKNKVRKAIEKQAMILENQRLLTHLREHATQLERSLEERKKMEAELIQSEKLAGIGVLAAGIAHEIASPLFGILGLAEAILDEDNVPLVHDYAREIVEYSKQIREIVQELSAYSRTAKMEGVTTVEIRRVVEDALKLAHRSRKMDGIEVGVELEDGLCMFARPNEIQQLLVNLVKNAVDAFEALPPGAPRRIKVSGKREDGGVVLRVSDSGCGIPPSAIERIFDPFFTTKGVGKGTGLGLNIVYRIVTRHEGTITVESIPLDARTLSGRSSAGPGTAGSSAEPGTSFTMRFPIRDS